MNRNIDNTQRAVRYLHDVHSHACCGHALNIANQPMDNLSTDEALEAQPLLFGQQLYSSAANEESNWSEITHTHAHTQTHTHWSQTHSQVNRYSRGVLDGLQDLH